MDLDELREFIARLLLLGFTHPLDSGDRPPTLYHPKLSVELLYAQGGVYISCDTHAKYFNSFDEAWDYICRWM